MDHSKSLLFSMISYILLLLFICTPSIVRSATVTVDVGVILDMDSYVGKMGMTSLNMALDDFYTTHQNYTTRLVLHPRDSKGDAVEAASAAIELIKDYQTKAILGPQLSMEAEFIAKLGSKSQVPIVSFSATSTLVSHLNTPYFIRMAEEDTFQMKAMAAIVDFFNWSEIVPIYEGTDYGSGILSYLSEQLQETGVRIPYHCAISPSATDGQILEDLHNLTTKQTRVFVVHMLPSLASRVFLKAKEAGMMSNGYAWIVTAGIISIIDSMDSSVIDSMQGVIGVEPYIPEVDQFRVRWMQKFHQDYPEINHVQLNAFSLWAYDSISVLAMAVQNAIGISESMDSKFKKSMEKDNLTDLAAIGISESGPRLLRSILTTRLKGLSGEINLKNGQLPLSPFQIVNLVGNESKVIGFWTEKGISEQFPASDLEAQGSLSSVTWPGYTTERPKGWEIPLLKVGVPKRATGRFSQYLNVTEDPQTKEVTAASGYCIEVFEAAIKLLPYKVPFKYVPFDIEDGNGSKSGKTYDDLVEKVNTKGFDAAVGDITITADRAHYVDFTLPVVGSGVSMIVPVKDDKDKRAWIFLKPLTMNLWLTIVGFFMYTGIVIWVLEHKVNEEFRGPPRKQIGTMFWFSFSTLVFANRERISNNLSRFVLIVWFFAVLVLTQSYTANLTSMLTVQQLQPTVSDISELIRNGDYIGYQEGSFVSKFLKTLNVDKSKLKNVENIESYNDELQKGSKNGGVSAIVDELPYLRLFLADYRTKYKMIGPTYKVEGFGFAFPKGSPLVPEFSRAILTVTESDLGSSLIEKYFGNQASCAEQDNTASVTSDSLSLESFKGLFLITGLASTTALVIFFCNFLFQNKAILRSQEPVKQKITEMAKVFDEKKESNDSDKKKVNRTEKEAQLSAFYDVPQGFIIGATPSPGAISLSNQEEGASYHDEGLSTSNPGTPYHDFASMEVENTPDRH